MPKITCKQCGATGSSKNPYTRSIFMDDQLEAMFSNMFGYKIIRKEGKCPTVEMSVSYLAGEEENVSEYVLLQRALKWMKSYLDKCPVETLACNHGDKGWEMDSEPTC